MGYNKPLDSDEFLDKFTKELSDTLKNGVTILNKKVFVGFKAIIFDAPARAYVTGTPGHTSGHGYTKCLQVARKITYVLTYSTKCEDPISDEDFRARKYPSHHTSKYFKVQSAFEKLEVLMVTQVPLDCMHLVELSVMRKFLQRLYNNKVV